MKLNKRNLSHKFIESSIMSKRKKIRSKKIYAHNLKLFEPDHFDTSKIAKNNFVLQLANFDIYNSHIYIDYSHVSWKFVLFRDYS